CARPTQRRRCARCIARSSNDAAMTSALKVALVGYGKMGREVEGVLRERGHACVPVLVGAPFPKDCKVGVDFTRGDAVEKNVEAALGAGAKYVIGTTGWDAQKEAVRRLVEGARGGVVHAANFSLGVNLFYRVVRDAAALVARLPEYDPYVL